MSVRICYVERGERGNSIKRVRLIGQNSGSAMEPSAGQARIDPPAAADWISKQLAGTRDSRAVSMLCLDTDGAACCWLTSPSTDPAVLNIVARSGGAAVDDGQRGGAPVDYYAPGVMESSIEALGSTVVTAPPRARLLKSKQPAATSDQAVSSRLAILAMSDVPGRLLVDALDKENIPVESAASMWHAMAMAWDPGWAPAGDVSVNDPLTPKPRPPVCATVLMDPSGKLLWCWSKSGLLLVAGSMRLRSTTSEDESPTFTLGEEEVSRLATEWIAWGAQISCVPQHITLCALEGSQGEVSVFGGLLSKAFPGTPLDAGFYADPIVATIEKVANRMEQTPIAPVINGGNALVGLSGRRGRQHRTYYFWTAAAIGAAGAIAVATGYQFRSMATQARERTADVAARSGELVKEYFPTARAGPGYSLLAATTDEVNKLRAAAEPPKRTEPPIPILEELASVAMIIGSGNYALESIELESSSTSVPKMTVQAKSLADEEALNEALRSISGLHVEAWIPDANTDLSRPGIHRINYRAKWLPIKPKADVTPDTPAKPDASSADKAKGGAT